MLVDYVTWYKNLEVKLLGRSGLHLLLSSCMAQPADLLTEHLGEYLRHGLPGRFSVPYAWGHVGLIEKIADRYGSSPENVLITHGVSNGIYLVCRLLLSRGDHVVIESPAYEPLVASPEFIGCRISCLNRRPPGYKIDPGELSGKITPETRVVIISNLHNPGGALLSSDELLALAARGREINPELRIVVDEVYHDFVHGSEPAAFTLDDCFVSLNSLTKVYGLEFVHCGWVIADEMLVRRLQDLVSVVYGSGSGLLEGITAAIFDHVDTYHGRSVDLLAQNREVLKQRVEPLFEADLLEGDIPPHGCMFFPKVSGLDDSWSFVEKLAREYQVYVVPGRFFGQPGHVRIGFGGLTEELEKALERFASAAQALLT